MRNPRTSRRILFVLSAAGPALLLLPGGCRRAGPASSGTPAPGPARVYTAADDWPAFHGGGPLLGAATPIGPGRLSLRWAFKAGKDDESAPFNGSAAIVAGVVYVGDGAGVLHAIDLRTGKEKWGYKAESGFETTPLVFEGKVMLGDLEGKFHCVSAAAGQKLWTFDGGTVIHSSANVAGGGAEARVVFGNDDSTVFCLSASDGKKLWEQSAGAKVNGAPAVGAGVAFVAGCDAHLHAMNLADGSEKFSADLGNYCPGSPAIAGDRIVVGTDGGRVVCFNADGSRQLWLYEGVGEQAMVFSSPAVADGVAVVGARDHSVYALDLATGARRWVFPTHGDVDSSPAVSGGRVFVGSRDRKLYVLDLATGKELEAFTAGHPVTAGPAVGEGVVVIGDTGGNLYCLEPK